MKTGGFAVMRRVSTVMASKGVLATISAFFFRTFVAIRGRF